MFVLMCWAGNRLVRLRLPWVPRTVKPSLKPTFSGLSYWWIPVLIVGGMYLVFLVDALTRYPSGHDTLHYHLPQAVRWMQQQRLDLVLGTTAQTLPENGMIAPFLLAFSRSEHLFTVVHLPKALLLAGVTFGLAQALGVRRIAAIVAGLLALSVPMVVFQSFSGYVDLYAAASWLSAVLALAWASRAEFDRGRRGLIILAGLSAGVALGSKTTYLIMNAMLLLAAVSIDWIRPRARQMHQFQPVRNGLLFGLASLVCSGFWFARNTVQAGNPLYPFRIAIAGHEILPGCYTMDWAFPERTFGEKVLRWWDYPWREPKYSGTGPDPGYPYSRNNGVGAAYTAFVPIGLVAVCVTAFRRRPRTTEEIWQLLYLGFAVSGMVLVVTVFKEMLRYILPHILLAIPVAAILMDRLIHSRPQPMALIVSASLAVTAAVATLEPAHAFAGRWKDGRWDRAWFYQVPELVNNLEPGATVLNLSRPVVGYALLGRHLDNSVITPIHWDVLMEGDPISADALRGHGIHYVFVHEPWPDDWPADLPLKLICDTTRTRILESTPAARIYRVEPAMSARLAGRTGSMDEAR
jgi:hypothetical protein